MGESFRKLITSKGNAYFWFALSITFFVVDIMTGNWPFAVLMLLVAFYWAYELKTIYNGTNLSYNKYYGKK